MSVPANLENDKLYHKVKELVDLYGVIAEISPDSNVAFKLRAFRRLLQVVGAAKKPITCSKEVVAKGVGPGGLKRVDEVLQTGDLAELSDLRKEVDQLKDKAAAMTALMEVVDIGRVLAAKLYDKHHVESVEDLKRLLLTKPDLVNDKVRLGLKYHGQFQGNIPRQEIEATRDMLDQEVPRVDPDSVFEVCGSFRRGLPASSDIDVLLFNFNLVTRRDVERSDLLHRTVQHLKDIGFITDDITDKGYTTKYMGFCKTPYAEGIMGFCKSPYADGIMGFCKSPYAEGIKRRIDIRLMPWESYVAAITYFTGSYQLNVNMRKIAKRLGYLLNEYGLFKEVGERSLEAVDLESEEHLFELLGMPYLLPTERSF